MDFYSFPVGTLFLNPSTGIAVRKVSEKRDGNLFKTPAEYESYGKSPFGWGGTARLDAESVEEFSKQFEAGELELAWSPTLL